MLCIWLSRKRSNPIPQEPSFPGPLKPRSIVSDCPSSTRKNRERATVLGSALVIPECELRCACKGPTVRFVGLSRKRHIQLNGPVKGVFCHHG